MTATRSAWAYSDPTFNDATRDLFVITGTNGKPRIVRRARADGRSWLAKLQTVSRNASFAITGDHMPPVHLDKRALLALLEQLDITQDGRRTIGRLKKSVPAEVAASGEDEDTRDRKTNA